jgi:hypothetical protein
MISYWFKGKELAFALGIAITFPELGNALNSWLTPVIYEGTGSIGTPFLVSVFICLISLGCALAAAHLDRKADAVPIIYTAGRQRSPHQSRRQPRRSCRHRSHQTVRPKKSESIVLAHRLTVHVGRFSVRPLHGRRKPSLPSPLLLLPSHLRQSHSHHLPRSSSRQRSSRSPHR